MHPDPTSRPWQEAWQDALYGENGFYRRSEGPAGHFRTAVHASTGGVLARALAGLARRTGCRRVVDVGAGRGELVTALHAVDPALELHGVDVVPRPPGLPDAIGWTPAPGGSDGVARAVPDDSVPTLLVAWELLDVVPSPVLEVDQDGLLRVVLVDGLGRERRGGAPSPADVRWCERWWPGPHVPGTRVEVGGPRDALWDGLVRAVPDGVLLAVDYDHQREARPAGGTLTAYRGGRQVPPVPDGHCDLTSHVALDALPGAGSGHLVRQHEALRWLGVEARRPDPARAGTDARRYLTDLAEASEAAELLDPDGLGGFGWLVVPRGTRAAGALAGLDRNGHRGPVQGSVPGC